MIVQEATRDLEQSGMGKTVQAKIKASRKLFNFFSDGVYSNKPVAICRELVANAIDSHVMAGRPNVPVDVILPTALEPTFTVRDFGTGMSEDFLFNNYLVYAEGSTKDGSNEAIGGFGIGKAAVFSYTDQFSLVSVQDGVKGVYSVFVGDDGIPAISQIAVTTTDDHNGVEISFPVEDKDIDTFHQAAQTALQFFHPMPNVQNGTVTPPDYSFVGNNWALRGQAGELGVILGGVRYPVVASSLERSLQNNEKLKPLLGYGIDLTMPIGSVSIALSREALSYNEQTSKAITTALLAIFDDVKQTFGTMFDKEPTLWQAAAKLYAETGHAQPYSRNARQQLLAANALYKGQPLSVNLEVAKVTGGKLWLVEAKSSWGRQRSVKTPKWESFAEMRILIPGNIEKVIIDDMAATPKSKKGDRLAEFFLNAPRSKPILIIRPTMPDDIQVAPDSKDVKALLLALGSPPHTLMSDLVVPVKTAAQAKAAGVRPRVRMFTFDGSKESNHYGVTGNTITNLTPSRYKPGVREVKYADQPDTGTMVVMDNFDLPKDFHEKMRTGVVAFSELVFVNKLDEPKLDKFVKFDDLFAKRLPAALAALPKDVNERLAVYYEPTLSQVWPMVRKLNEGGNLSSLLTATQKATPFGQMVTLFYDYVNKVDNDQIKFMPFLKPALPAGVDPVAILAEHKNGSYTNLIVLLGLLTDKYRTVTRAELNLLAANF